MPQSVLVIDDSEDIHRLLRARLKDEDVEIFDAADGPSGIEAARQLRPDLILLDVEMPGLGGFDVCRELKNDPATTPIPIIFLTGVSDPAERVKGLELGAVDYVIKPFDFAELRARVRAGLRTVRYQKLLEQRAQIDGLTGLWNRVYFDQRLHEVLSGCRRYGGPVSLVMVDIDHFKRINDTHGHRAGDLVLQDFYRRALGVTRSTDTICRWGGEEFLILLPDTPTTGACYLAERLHQAVVTAPFRVGSGKVLHVTVTIGVATVRAGEDLLDAVHRADAALYQGKQQGRNQVVLSQAPTGQDARPERARSPAMRQD